MTRGGGAGRAVAPAVAAWFAGWRELSAVAEAVLEGRQGSAAVASDAARLSLGCYQMFAGEPGGAGAGRLLAGLVAPTELVFGNDPAWRARILAVHGPAVVDRPMVDFDPAGVVPEVLRRFGADSLPAGYTLQALDGPLAAQLAGELEPHALQAYADAAAFAAEGLGFGIVTADGRLACAATSYARSSRQVEVAIATRPEHRGRGLAAVAAAALLGRCLQLGLVPRWSASNPVSQRLAVRLGFRPAGTCEVLYLR